MLKLSAGEQKKIEGKWNDLQAPPSSGVFCLWDDG